MVHLRFAGLVVAALWTLSCSPPPPPAPSVPEVAVEGEAEPEALSDLPPEGGAGGSGSDDPTPAQLTGLPGIDRAQDLEIRILDARGNGRLGGRPIPAGTGSTLTTGEWLLSEDGSEYEITLRSALLPDGIVRLHNRSAFLVEEPVAGRLPRFRVFAGQASFYLPQVPQGELIILTPAGRLMTRGAVFSVTVSPDFQVLITCREGAVYLTGSQNAVAQPGQVVVADRLGRGRVYPMTPNESSVFADRWLKIMAEEAGPVLEATLDRRWAEWRTALALDDVEAQRFGALWFREAQTILGTKIPGPEAWSFPLTAELRPSLWRDAPEAPGLLGELP